MRVIDNPLAQGLGLRTGNEHTWLHLHHALHERCLAQHILYGLGLAQALHHGGEPLLLLVVEMADAIAQDVGHRHSEPFLEQRADDGLGLTRVVERGKTFP